jgi:hypothetical protein
MTVEIRRQGLQQVVDCGDEVVAPSIDPDAF